MRGTSVSTTSKDSSWWPLGVNTDARLVEIMIRIIISSITPLSINNFRIIAEDVEIFTRSSSLFAIWISLVSLTATTGQEIVAATQVQNQAPSPHHLNEKERQTTVWFNRIESRNLGYKQRYEALHRRIACDQLFCSDNYSLDANEPSIKTEIDVAPSQAVANLILVGVAYPGSYETTFPTIFTSYIYMWLNPDQSVQDIARTWYWIVYGEEKGGKLPSLVQIDGQGIKEEASRSHTLKYRVKAVSSSSLREHLCRSF